jgi:hypothetical protein
MSDDHALPPEIHQRQQFPEETPAELGVDAVVEMIESRPLVVRVSRDGSTAVPLEHGSRDGEHVFAGGIGTVIDDGTQTDTLATHLADDDLLCQWLPVAEAAQFPLGTDPEPDADDDRHTLFRLEPDPNIDEGGPIRRLVHVHAPPYSEAYEAVLDRLSMEADVLYQTTGTEHRVVEETGEAEQVKAWFEADNDDDRLEAPEIGPDEPAIIAKPEEQE